MAPPPEHSQFVHRLMDDKQDLRKALAASMPELAEYLGQRLISHYATSSASCEEEKGVGGSTAVYCTLLVGVLVCCSMFL